MHSDLSTYFQSNVDLQALNTLSVPAVAEWFCEVTAQSQLFDVLSLARQHDLSLTIIGGGSNIVLPRVVKGLVLNNALLGRFIVSDTDEDVVLECAAGENWHDTVMWCVDNGYYGLENLALIPGSIGAAPIQNIGAYGVELESCFEYLKAINIADGKIIHLTKEQCQFGYRDSVFKHALQDKVIIFSVALRLQKKPHFVLDYPGLSQLLGSSRQTLSAKDVAHAVMSIRKKKLPNPSEIPNAGSFFKNPVIDHKHLQVLQAKYADIVAYPLANGECKLAAAWLLDKAGWKGRFVDGISMHKHQALVLTNPNYCSGQQVMLFAEQVCGSIKEAFGIRLEIEPRVYIQ